MYEVELLYDVEVNDLDGLFIKFKLFPPLINLYFNHIFIYFLFE